MSKVTLKKSVENKIRANARRGARTLDGISDNWFMPGKLSLKRLNMQSSCDCVWGQLDLTNLSENEKFQEKMATYNGTGTPGYVPNYDKDDGGDCHVDERAHWSGFLTREKQEIRNAIIEEEWRVLQDEWASLIRIRRNARRS